jgi:SAM-dependent methyltransferase
MLPSHVTDELNRIEAIGPALDRDTAIAKLRPIGLGDFGLVLASFPDPAFPNLSAVLPMAPEATTVQWTGSPPVKAMEQGASFVRMCAERYTALTGQTLEGRSILDFGCGYGRYVRLFSFYSDEVVGVDAWDASLKSCRECGWSDKVFKSDDVPQSLPVPGKFDLLTAFSVFTHLSKDAATQSLKALREAARDGAILAMTFRAIEYWPYMKERSLATEPRIPELMREHETDGFAFLPSPGAAHYGHTSMTVDWLRKYAEGWDVAALDRSADAGLQRCVFLKAT